MPNAAPAKNPSTGFLKLMRNLRAVREYTPQPVDEQTIHQILEVARWTGTGSNKQPTDVIVVRDPEVKRKMAELANESGFEIAELFGGNRGRKRTTSSAKYRNPKDASQTWTGRGRKPNWLVEALGQGAKLESFEV